MGVSESTMDLASKYVMVDGTRIHYFEQGQGDPVIFLHGVPVSAWVWRKVIPHISPLLRCIAPDLAGFGQSGQSDRAYTLSDQIRFLEGLVEALQLNRITLVMHGWGGIAGLVWAMRNPTRCRALVFYETWMRPVTEESLSLPWEEFIDFWRQDKNLESVAMNGLSFVDKMLRQTSLDFLDENTIAHYCAPFSHTGAGKSLSGFLSEAPTGDGQSVADKFLLEAANHLQHSKLPKLLLYSVPGFLMTMASIEWAKKHLTALEVVDVGEAWHYAQEHQAARMGETMSVWLQGIE